MFRKSSQVHSVRDIIYPIERGHDQRDNHFDILFHPLAELLFFRELKPSCLLGLGNDHVFRRNIWKIAQGQAKRKGNFIVDSESVHA